VKLSTGHRTREWSFSARVAKREAGGVPIKRAAAYRSGTLVPYPRLFGQAQNKRSRMF
jgi:hypothetical protein